MGYLPKPEMHSKYVINFKKPEPSVLHTFSFTIIARKVRFSNYLFCGYNFGAQKLELSSTLLQYLWWISETIDLVCGIWKFPLLFDFSGRTNCFYFYCSSFTTFFCKVRRVHFSNRDIRAILSIRSLLRWQYLSSETHLFEDEQQEQKVSV